MTDIKLDDVKSGIGFTGTGLNIKPDNVKIKKTEDRISADNSLPSTIPAETILNIASITEKAKKSLDERKFDEAYNLVKEYSSVDVEGNEKKDIINWYILLGDIYNLKELGKKRDYNKAKDYYKKAVDLESIVALDAFAGAVNTVEYDTISYLVEKYKEFDDDKRNSRFYAEYGRMLKCLYNKNNNELNIDLKQIFDLYKKAILLAPNSCSPYLYMGRLLKDCGDKLPQEDPLVPNSRKAEEYYTLAVKKGSTLAVGELDSFYRKQDPELSFDLMNSSENLEQLISNLTEPYITNSFSMLLSGPRGSGKEVFAQKVMNAVQCEYEQISIADFSATNCRFINFQNQDKSEARSVLEYIRFLENQKHKGVVFLNVDKLFSKTDRFFGTTALEIITNIEGMIKAVKSNKFPVILIIDNPENICQELRNAFMFRINFNYMDNPQKEAAYNLFFNFEAPDYLHRLGGLVVEDFSRVKRKAKILNILDSSEKILALLEDEAKYKAGGSTSYLKPDMAFDYKLVNADLNLSELTEKLKEKGQDKPFSMIIYGPPGTGKSYYLRYLADQLGIGTLEMTAANLLSKWTGETNKNITNMFREAENRKAMIIIDEIETLIKDRESEDNTFRNEIVNTFLTELDAVKYPFACTTNYIDKVDKAALRRFVFKTKFDYLTKEQNDLAFKTFFKFDPPDELKRIGGLTNGDYSSVKKRAILLDKMNDCDAIMEMLKEESKRKGKAGLISDAADAAKAFDIGFINTDLAMLEGFIRNIKKEGRTKFSFLLYGPSGTGKSLYLRHIADQLGYEIIERRTSDILDRWHGGTSRNIAAAFKEAKERKAFLIFDEIDGILLNKKNLNNINSWMADQVNEFLVQMENHDYPFAGTTNYLDNVEPAALRRFSVKALFDYLCPDQYDYVYEKTFGFKPVKDISNLKKMTPALFKTVKNKAEISDVANDKEKVFDLFMKEAEIAGNKIKTEDDRSYEKITIKKKSLYEKPIADMYNEVLKGFVKILSAEGHGSGFFISADGFILTNRHVVHDEKFVTVELFTGRQVPGEVLRSNSIDVALIKISDENLCVPMPLRTEEPNPGTAVFSMGNPHDKDQVLTKGVITRYTTNTEGKRRIESDVLTRGGVSGGPLMDEYGNVLGLNVEGWLDRDSNYHTKMGLAMEVPIIDALEALSIEIRDS